MRILLQILLILFLTSCSVFSGDPLYDKLHKNIYKINNQSFFGEPVNTYLIELDDKVLLIDLPTYSEDLKDFILSFKKPVVAVLSHGSSGIPHGETWQEMVGLRVYLHQADAGHPWLRMEPEFLFTEIPHFADNIEIIHTPGHSAGSVCVYEKTTQSLFTGDTFQGDEQGGIVDFTREKPESYENIEERIASCKKLLEYPFKNAYPFHYHRIEQTAHKSLQDFLADK